MSNFLATLGNSDFSSQEKINSLGLSTSYLPASRSQSEISMCLVFKELTDSSTHVPKYANRDIAR